MNIRITPKAVQTNETDFIDPDQLKDVFFLYFEHLSYIFLTVCVGVFKQYLMNILENKRTGKRKPNDI